MQICLAKHAYWKTQEAIGIGDKAVTVGKAAKANTSGLEKDLADWKAKKM
jgi:hypothetical protein